MAGTLPTARHISSRRTTATAISTQPTASRPLTAHTSICGVVNKSTIPVPPESAAPPQATFVQVRYAAALSWARAFVCPELLYVSFSSRARTPRKTARPDSATPPPIATHAHGEGPRDAWDAGCSLRGGGGNISGLVVAAAGGGGSGTRTSTLSPAPTRTSWSALRPPLSTCSR